MVPAKLVVDISALQPITPGNIVQEHLLSINAMARVAQLKVLDHSISKRTKVIPIANLQRKIH
jgi:hypothetical protein